MGFIQRLKVALGLVPRERERSTRGQASSDQDVAVTVEHEPDTDTEDAVKGTETGTDEPTAQPDEPSVTEESGSDEGEADKTETEETDTDQTETEETETDQTETEETATTTDDTEAEAESAGGDDSEDVQSISGIGPAYAERLGEANIETVADLAAADAATVAEETGIAEGRVSTWIERAGE